MLSRKAAALALCASLAAAPVVDLSLATSAAAQDQATNGARPFKTAVAPTQAQIVTRVRAAIAAARSAPGYAALTPAQRSQAVVNAIGAVIQQVIEEGGTSASISGAMAILVADGTLSASLATQGVGVGMSLAAADGYSSPAGLLAAVEASTGFQLASVGAIGGPGGFNAFANNNGVGGTNVGGAFDPCAGVVADYC